MAILTLISPDTETDLATTAQTSPIAGEVDLNDPLVMTEEAVLQNIVQSTSCDIDVFGVQPDAADLSAYMVSMARKAETHSAKGFKFITNVKTRCDNTPP